MTGFVWCDLSAYRPAVAHGFYARVLGWEIDAGDYPMAYADAEPVAAIFQMPAKFMDICMPSFWMSYVAGPSVADTVAAARDLGAIIEVETSFGDGRIALIRDPLGAGFTAYEGAMPPGAAGRARAGVRAGHMQFVSDAARAAGFYAALFDWEATPAGESVWVLSAGGAHFAAIYEVPAEQRAGKEYWAVAFTVAAFPVAREAIEAAGGAVYGEVDLLDGTALAAADMDGAAFFLVEADG